MNYTVLIVMGLLLLSIILSITNKVKNNGTRKDKTLDKFGEQDGVTDHEVENIDDELHMLIAEGQKIKAIKRYRMATGLGLKEAKDYIDLLASGGAKVVGTGPVAQNIDDELNILISQGQKIKAIKRYRMATGLGLKEAKDYVDALSLEQK